VKRVFLSICLIASGLTILPQGRLAFLVVTGRSPECPWRNAMGSLDHEAALTATKDEILRLSYMVKSDPGGYSLWQTPSGPFWIPRGSEYFLPFNLAEQVRQIYGTGDQAVRSGDIVLDCGANVGVYTRYALEAGAKLVVAIEPAPENLECLRRNFQSEVSSGRVIIYPKGVWDKDDVLTLQVDPNNPAADSFVIRREGGREVAQIPLTSIDKLASELQLPKVDYIKMDIEGAEQRAITGARKVLERFHPRLSLSAYHHPSDPSRLPVLVREAWTGYRMECGPCAVAGFRIRPDVLYFR